MERFLGAAQKERPPDFETINRRCDDMGRKIIELEAELGQLQRQEAKETDLQTKYQVKEKILRIRKRKMELEGQKHRLDQQLLKMEKSVYSFPKTNHTQIHSMQNERAHMPVNNNELIQVRRHDTYDVDFKRAQRGRVGPLNIIHSMQNERAHMPVNNNERIQVRHHDTYDVDLKRAQRSRVGPLNICESDSKSSADEMYTNENATSTVEKGSEEEENSDSVMDSREHIYFGRKKKTRESLSDPSFENITEKSPLKKKLLTRELAPRARGGYGPTKQQFKKAVSIPMINMELSPFSNRRLQDHENNGDEESGLSEIELDIKQDMGRNWRKILFEELTLNYLALENKMMARKQMASALGHKGFKKTTKDIYLVIVEWLCTKGTPPWMSAGEKKKLVTLREKAINLRAKAVRAKEIHWNVGVFHQLVACPQYAKMNENEKKRARKEMADALRMKQVKGVSDNILKWLTRGSTPQWMDADEKSILQDIREEFTAAQERRKAAAGEEDAEWLMFDDQDEHDSESDGDIDDGFGAAVPDEILSDEEQHRKEKREKGKQLKNPVGDLRNKATNGPRRELDAVQNKKTTQSAQHPDEDHHTVIKERELLKKENKILAAENRLLKKLLGEKTKEVFELKMEKRRTAEGYEADLRPKYLDERDIEKSGMKQLRKLTGSTVGEYKLGKPIGVGGFGMVFLAEHVVTKKVVAMKVVLDEEVQNDELSVMQQMKDWDEKNRFICTPVEYYSCRNEAIKKGKFSVFEMELLPSDLYRLCYEKEFDDLAFSSESILEILAQLFSGLHFLESHRVIYADVKQENIMIKSMRIKKIGEQQQKYIISAEVRLIDFNAVVKIGEQCVCQTTRFRAPEVILYRKFDAKIDCWSAGIMAMDLVRKEDFISVRYEDEDPMEEGPRDHLAKIQCAVGKRIPSKMLEDSGLQAKDVKGDCSKQPTVEDVLNELTPSAASEDLTSLVPDLLCIDPSKRLFPSEALSLLEGYLPK